MLYNSNNYQTWAESIARRIRGQLHAHACTTKMSCIKSSKTLITNDGALTNKTKVRSKNPRESSSNAQNFASKV